VNAWSGAVTTPGSTLGGDWPSNMISHGFMQMMVMHAFGEMPRRLAAQRSLGNSKRTVQRSAAQRSAAQTLGISPNSQLGGTKTYIPLKYTRKAYNSGQ